VPADAGVVVLGVVYQVKKPWQNARASAMEPNEAGKSGRYFRVLNCASE